MLEAFPWFDAAVSGRGEGTIVSICNRLAANESLADLPSVAWREGNRVSYREEDPVGPCLDDMPAPDYHDFFKLSAELKLRNPQPSVALEASVGCWWGEKNRCTFFALNAGVAKYQRKGPARVVEEIRDVGRTYAVDRIMFTDNAFPLEYFDTLLPSLEALGNKGERYDVFVEIKTNIRKQQLLNLRAAGVRYFQPGIESLSDGILDLMHKGNRSINQVQFIKWGDELEMSNVYNIITHVPGETPADYEVMSRLIPSLVHLTPPSSVHPMQLQRFSAYFEDPARWDLTDVQPAAFYRDIFPGVAPAIVERLAYTFAFKHPTLHSEPLKKARFHFERSVARWQSVHKSGSCTYELGPGWIRIRDAREGVWFGNSVVRYVTLRGLQAHVYRALDAAKSVGATAREVGGELDTVNSIIAELARLRLVYFDGKRALALAVPANTHVFATANLFGRGDDWAIPLQGTARSRDRQPRAPGEENASAGQGAR